MAFSPLANVFLSGKYNAQSVFEKDTDYRAIMPQFQKYSYEKNQEFLAWIQALAEEKNTTDFQYYDIDKAFLRNDSIFGSRASIFPWKILVISKL